MLCEICGKEFDRPIYGGDSERCCSSECFTKKFWNDIEKEKEEHIFINGICYAIAEKPIFGLLGYGGRKFKIRMFEDGRIVETNNLWCQGDIPEEYRFRLPNTAEFVK